MDKTNCINKIKSAVRNGNHPDPPVSDAFQQTSVIALLMFNQEIKLMFIQKADVKGYAWANQMAFPGGHKDKKDASTKETALRELAEEMGISKDNVEVVGSLGHFQTMHHKSIEAFIGIWNQKDALAIDPAEISGVFNISLKYLIQLHKKKGYHARGTPNVMQLGYPFEDVLIWGVTAKIVYHLIETLLAE